MVDVLQNYMQDAISLVRMHRTDTSNHDDHGTTNYGTRRRATENQRRRNQLKEEEKKSYDQSLYQIKESALQKLQISSKPLSGLACKFCAPTHNVSVVFFDLFTQIRIIFALSVSRPRSHLTLRKYQVKYSVLD